MGKALNDSAADGAGVSSVEGFGERWYIEALSCVVEIRRPVERREAGGGDEVLQKRGRCDIGGDIVESRAARLRIKLAGGESL